ncbi:MAG: tRNA ((37)-N6)-methyltransferase TrmO [Verrucomicrobiota bacterium]
MEIEPVGILRTCFGDKFGTPRQPGLCPSAWGELEFSDRCRSPDAVRGLEGFSHIWLIFGFHKTIEEGWSPTVRPPRLGGNARVGVFASRSTFRPNGLGLSLVKLDKVDLEGGRGLQPPILHVSGVDLVDGTPIYDVKPYLPYAESVAGAESGYAGSEIPRMEVEIEAGARKQFDMLDQRSQRVIREVLGLDARPAASRKSAHQIYGANLCGRNVRFRVEGNTCWLVGV